MQYKNPFSDFRKREYAIWLFSLAAVTVSFFLSPTQDLLSLFASLVGVTALIFVARGDPLGQLLCILFSLLYAAVSYRMQYYGEMITYLCMSAPMALATTISWLRHPYENKANEVRVAKITGRTVLLLFLSAIPVTLLSYFILMSLGTASLTVSTLSVTTSFLAAALTFLRSPFYGLGYAANDVVLIALWIFASVRDPRYLPMILCFLAFLVNDVYGFWNWQKIKKEQNKKI